MKKISIIGSGWLGLKLIDAFQPFFEVKASFQQEKTKAQILDREAIPVEVSDKNVDEGIFQCDTLVINVPPKIRVDQGDRHKKILQTIVQKVKPGTQVLYCNSTGIYASGEALKEAQCNINSIFYQFEELLKPLHPVILRLGGLVAEDRVILDALIRKKRVVNGDEVVNFVRREDVVAIIASIVTAEIKGKVWNVVAPGHPNKKELYTHWSKALTLSKPTFSDHQGTIKSIDGTALQNELNYKYKFPDPLTFWG